MEEDVTIDDNIYTTLIHSACTSHDQMKKTDAFVILTI